jgi:hypothetical protein
LIYCVVTYNYEISVEQWLAQRAHNPKVTRSILVTDNVLFVLTRIFTDTMLNFGGFFRVKFMTNTPSQLSTCVGTPVIGSV